MARTTTRRLLLCGAGRVAERYYAPALLRSPHFRVEAVVDIDPTRREWAARAFGVPGFSSAIEALSAHEFDAALVLTPPETQAEIAGEILRHGIPVLTEKPGAQSTADAEGLLQAANGVPLRLALARRFWRRYRNLGHTTADQPAAWRIEIETDPIAWGRQATPADPVQALIEDLLPHSFDLATHVLRVDVSNPARISVEGTSIRLEYEGQPAGTIRITHGSRWHESVHWAGAAGPARRVTSERTLLSRAGERLALGLRLRRPEPVEAIELLLAGFAADVASGTTNDDLRRCAGLISRARELLGLPSGVQS